MVHAKIAHNTPKPTAMARRVFLTNAVISRYCYLMATARSAKTTRGQMRLGSSVTLKPVHPPKSYELTVLVNTADCIPEHKMEVKLVLQMFVKTIQLSYKMELARNAVPTSMFLVIGMNAFRINVMSFRSFYQMGNVKNAKSIIEQMMQRERSA